MHTPEVYPVVASDVHPAGSILNRSIVEWLRRRNFTAYPMSVFWGNHLKWISWVSVPGEIKVTKLETELTASEDV